ncbi:MAG: DUF3419 family protein [Hyphomicrobiales bacterium]
MQSQNTQRQDAEQTEAVAKDKAEHLRKAVYQHKATSRAGFSERLFTWLFRGLVYPQIWEGPDVDMQALQLGPQSRLITIASGGCNVLSYLTQDPKEILAVDLNTAHIALTRLKLKAVEALPNYETFYRFFGEADEKANLRTYERFLQNEIDAPTKAYWEGRDRLFRKRITLFSRDLYHHGLLGYFIGVTHFVAKLYGIDPADLTKAKTMEEQRSFFEGSLAPIFDKRLVRWVTSKKSSLFGLGIPPAQYDVLAGGGDISVILKQRVEKLACHFSMNDNYFAWQAFGRGYAPNSANDDGTSTSTGRSGPLPPYLQAQHFDHIKSRANRVSVTNKSVTEKLKDEADESMDGYVLLDAQDWMTDQQLNELWSQITRTAKTGARVIFRTADEPSLLPGRVVDEILGRWSYQEEQSLTLNKHDRSAIYGGFHLYVKN